jgi:nucleoside 2-deoxyribosyltransferase
MSDLFSLDEVYHGVKVFDSKDWEFDPGLTYYLAGPMSGYPEYNFPLFDVAAAVLRASKFSIQSPHEIDHGETAENRGGLPYQTYIDAGLKMLESCQGIILLPGWPQSSGSCAELSRSIDLGMPVYAFLPLGDGSFGLVSMNARPPR